MTTNTWPGWKCVEQLGEGSYGKVFRICREDFGTTYEAALKVITIPKSKNEIESAYAEGMDDKSVTTYFYSFVEDIVAEFALMSQVKGNTNIVSYEDHMVVQHEDGIGWDILIRMELLTSLLSYTKQHPMGESDVIRLGVDMARALKVCRKKGIIHRDIKPENIFVNKDGDFKLGDFGVARIAEKTISVMSQKGTYIYMAPEVYKGEAYGYSADLYSLGLVLYRLLNDNRMPFMPPAPQPIKYSDRENALNARMMNQPMSGPAHGSQTLKDIVLKACAYDPADRFADAEELERALLQLENGTGVDIKPVYEEEDDFDKTVGSFRGYQSKKETVSKEVVVPAVQEEENAWGQPVEEDDDEYEDDFDKTISTLDSYQSRKKKLSQPVEEEVNESPEEMAEDEDDEFDRTVSAFADRSAKRKSEAEKERKKAELAKKVEENEKNRKAAGKKPMGKGVKIVIALLISLLVAIPLPPVGIGLAAILLVFILLQK